MNNAILMTVYDRTQEQHDLTIGAFESALAQDIPVDIFIIDNGSTFPATKNWLEGEHRTASIFRYPDNQSPLKLVNEYTKYLFNSYPHILGMPNDVVLPPNLYREFLKWPRGIVTGSMHPGMDFTRFESSSAVSEKTPMAVALLRKWAWDALIAKDGFLFDERFNFYCSDCDFALRVASCGIRGIQLDLQYYHYGSASHRLADGYDFGGNADRNKFHEKWGFAVTDYEYGARAADINFKD